MEGESLDVVVRFTPAVLETLTCEVDTGNPDCGSVYCTGFCPGASGVDDLRPGIFALRQNRPDPFSETTRIDFSLDHEYAVLLRVYDISGSLIRTIVDRRLPAGAYSEVWDGRDAKGREAVSGVYFILLRGDTETLVRKAILLR